MKIAIWNIIGLNQPLKQNGVRNLNKQHDLDIIGVLETKFGLPKLDRIMQSKFGVFFARK